MSNNEENKNIIYPLDIRSKEEQEARVKGWNTWALMHSVIMDRLVGMSAEEIEALKSILFSNRDIITLNENLLNYMMIEGLIKGEIEFDYSAYEDDPNT